MESSAARAWKRASICSPGRRQGLFTFGAVLTPATVIPGIQGWLVDSYNWIWLFGMALVFLAAALLLMFNADSRGTATETRARFTSGTARKPRPSLSR